MLTPSTVRIARDALAAELNELVGDINDLSRSMVLTSSYGGNQTTAFKKWRARRDVLRAKRAKIEKAIKELKSWADSGKKHTLCYDLETFSQPPFSPFWGTWPWDNLQKEETVLPQK